MGSRKLRGNSVGLREVALLAGVSTATVSNTINRPSIVRPSTRAVVERAIESLGFVPSEPARLLKSSESQVLGLVVLDSRSPFFMAIARSVEDAANETDQVVIVCNSDSSPEREAKLLRLLAAQRVKGALLTPAADRPELGRLQLPVVYVDHRGEADECSVSVDDVVGGELAVRHLLELGHKKIAFVGGHRATRQFRDRADGARRTILAAGLDPENCLIEFYMDDMGIGGGVLASDAIVSDPEITAVFCGNDMLAFGVYRGLARKDLRVPEDISLVGYDDNEFAADWIVPLTSVRQPTYEMGYKAASLLNEHADARGDHEHSQVVLQPTLIIRQSTAPPTR